MVRTIISLFPSAFGTVTIFTHAFGVVSLVSVWTLRDQPLFILNSSDNFDFLLCFYLLFLLESSPLEVMEDHTFIDFEIEVECFIFCGLEVTLLGISLPYEIAVILQRDIFHLLVHDNYLKIIIFYI